MNRKERRAMARGLGCDVELVWSETGRECAMCNSPMPKVELGEDGFFALPAGWRFRTLARHAADGHIEAVAMVFACSQACAIAWQRRAEEATS